MHDETRKQQRRNKALGFLPFRRWIIRWLETIVETVRSAAGGKPVTLSLPSPFPDEHTAGPGTRAPRVRRKTPSWRLSLWEGTAAVCISGLAFTLSWQARDPTPDLSETVHALQEQVAAQTRQLRTQTQQLDIHAIQLLAQTQRLDAAAHAVASHAQQLNAHADGITLNTQRLDAHADEFVLRIAQLEAHAAALDTQEKHLARQARTLTTQMHQLTTLRAHPASPFHRSRTDTGQRSLEHRPSWRLSHRCMALMHHQHRTERHLPSQLSPPLLVRSLRCRQT